MNGAPAPWDFVAILALGGSLLFSNSELSAALAPYVATFICALFGTMWAVSRIEKENGERMTRWEGIRFTARVVGAALVVTVPLAVWGAPKIGLEEYRYAVSPLAFIIGAVGDEWKPFLTWCRDFVLRWKSGTPET